MNELQITEEIKKILKSNRTTYEKKIALFNLVVKGLEVEKSDLEKEQRVNYIPSVEKAKLLGLEIWTSLRESILEMKETLTNNDKQ